MSTEEKIQATIITGLHAGRTVSEIVRFNNLKKSTVCDVKQRYDDFIAGGGLPEEFSSDRNVHRRRSGTLDATIVAKLLALVDQDPGRSMRSLARELEISEFVVRKKMMQDIRYKSYALRRGQFLSQATKNRRLEKAKLMLNKLKNPAANNQLIFFSDEKNFS
jgi:hypothetical protein